MVTITNGEKTFRVTAGSVKPYEGMGFHVVSDEELEAMENECHDDAGETEDSAKHDKDISKSKRVKVEESDISKEDVFVEELLEKPLSQWTNDEVKEFVKIKGIDTSGAQKVSQVRGIIKSYLEEQNRNV